MLWKFVEFLTTEPNEPEHQEAGTCGETLCVFYELDPPGSSYEDMTLRVVCPCFPDPNSDDKAYDYCLSISVFDGCPNYYRLVDNG